MSQTAGGSNVAKPEEYDLVILSASKNIIHSAKVSSYFRRSEEFGIHKDGSTIDMAAVRDRKRTMVTGLVDIHMENFKNSGAELILGSGRFTGPRTLEVMLPDGKTRQLLGTNVIIGTVEALELDEIHEHLLVIGGGYVGLGGQSCDYRQAGTLLHVHRSGICSYRS